MDAAQVSTIVDISPTTESQARELVPLARQLIEGAEVAGLLTTVNTGPIGVSNWRHPRLDFLGRLWQYGTVNAVLVPGSRFGSNPPFASGLPGIWRRSHWGRGGFSI